MVENALKVCHNKTAGNKCDDLIGNVYLSEETFVSAKECGCRR